MNGFVYDIPTRIYFGQDQLCHLGDELKKYGKKKNKQLSEASFAYTKDSGVVKIGTSHNLKKSHKKGGIKSRPPCGSHIKPCL